MPSATIQRVPKWCGSVSKQVIKPVCIGSYNNFMTSFCVGVGGEDVMEVFWGYLVDLVGGNCSVEFSPVRKGSPSKF